MIKIAINLPYSVFGKVFDTNGTTLVGSGVLVKLRNNSTNEILSTTTNSNSEYALNGGNFPAGYNNTDKFTVYVISANLEAEATLSVSDAKHQFNLTLSTISDSTLIAGYCNVQDVYDELDDLSETILSARRIIKTIQRAEREIDEFTGMKFVSTTVTQEIYDFNQYNASFSPESLEFLGNQGRVDYWNVINTRDRLFLRNRPIISITTLQRNTAGETGTDSFETLTEQTGSGGDYQLISDGKAAGYIDFIQNRPRHGKRSVRITYKHGYDTTPKNVEELTILLAVKQILRSKMSRSFFDTPHRISLKGIMVDRGPSPAVYLRELKDEIKELYETLGRDFKLV